MQKESKKSKPNGIHQKPSTNAIDHTNENDFAYLINVPQMANVYHVYLDSCIANQKHYRQVTLGLRLASNKDVFILYINNRGGSVQTTIDIVSAMKYSAATIYVRITGPIYSAAPLIALQGDKIIVEENAFMMFHDYSGGLRGKGHELAANIAHEKPFFDDFFKRMVKGFLTDAESKAVSAGKDLYLKRDTIMKRLKKLGKLATHE